MSASAPIRPWSLLTALSPAAEATLSQARINARFVAAALAAAFYTLLFGSLVILGAFLHVPRAWLDVCCRLWGRGILNWAGIRVQLEGLSHLPQTSAVLVGNHQGIFEILALIAYLPNQPVFVGKQEAFRIPLFGHAMRAFGHIAIDREDREQAITSIRQGAERLKAHNDQVVFFPEGTRTRDGKLKPFKKGAFVFALESDLKIVPFAVDGSFQALPPGRRVIYPGLVRLRFLPPIDTMGYDHTQRDQLRDLTRDRIAAAVSQMRETQPLTGPEPSEDDPQTDRSDRLIC